MSVRNAARAVRRLNALPAHLKRRIGDALEASAVEMANLAVVRVSRNSGTGRTYKRGGRVHIASSPGEYPNSDSGEYVRSIFSERRGQLSAVWGAAAKHALPLEMGTSRMAARPVLRPTTLALLSSASSRVMSAKEAAFREVQNVG